MPLARFPATIDPETLSLLTSSLEEAWQDHSAASAGSDPEAIRQLLAARIIQAYSEGARDKRSLVAAALRGLISH
jgi:hypothetical protein